MSNLPGFLMNIPGNPILPALKDVAFAVVMNSIYVCP
jgi:hypothetical protein